MRCENKILSATQLRGRMEDLRACSWTIVSTSGCFDLLHVGHIRSLQFAASQGGVLVVLINSDESVRRLKGPTRPIIPQSERAEMLAALSCVDYVSVFDDPTPERTLEMVRPSIHVKGGDYKYSGLIEEDTVKRFGGKCLLAPYWQGYSTTKLIGRVAEL